MIKAIANQKIDVSQEEYNYYLELEKTFGHQAFVGLFRTNEDGQIISVIPQSSAPTAMILVFYFLNLMFNQRLRKLDSWISKSEALEKRIAQLEEKAGV